MNMTENRLLHCFLEKLRKSTGKPLIEGTSTFYSTSDFHQILRIERKRADRSRKPCLLMLLDLSAIDTKRYDVDTLREIQNILVSCSREIDVRGWYERDLIAGTIFTEIGSIDETSIQTIYHRVQKKISDTFHDELLGEIRISFRPIVPSSAVHVLPQTVLVEKYERKEMEEPILFQASINVNRHADHVIRKLNAFTERVLQDIEKNMISETDGQRLIVGANIVVNMLTKT